MEERDSKDRQRSAAIYIIFNKKGSGAAGTDHFVLITIACPPVGIFDAGKVITIYNALIAICR
ncbi:hypothetical protein [Ignatzschineria cameli]|uniref:hypothetical protein n=1 Tax=Ignatzschineria cameli TaxID=2182793 RepID=UPI001057977D|nr:hypothetical protein [Ignatzschineria cameli]